MLCDDPDGWDEGSVGRRSRMKGMYIYIHLANSLHCTKLTQHCKAIIFQFFKKRDVNSHH